MAYLDTAVHSHHVCAREKMEHIKDLIQNMNHRMHCVHYMAKSFGYVTVIPICFLGSHFKTPPLSFAVIITFIIWVRIIMILVTIVSCSIKTNLNMSDGCQQSWDRLYEHIDTTSFSRITSTLLGRLSTTFSNLAVGI